MVRNTGQLQISLLDSDIIAIGGDHRLEIGHIIGGSTADQRICGTRLQVQFSRPKIQGDIGGGLLICEEGYIDIIRYGRSGFDLSFGKVDVD